MREQRSRGRVCESLKMFTGEFDMQLVSRENSERATELAIGRRCLNCDDPTMGRFIVIPAKTQILLLCEACVVHIAQDAVDTPVPPPVSAADVYLVQHSLSQILEETGDG